MRGPTDELPSSEIITGERLQALADLTLLPRMIARRGRGPGGGSKSVIEFESHRALGADQLARVSAARSIFVYSDALELFQRHVWPRMTGSSYVLITHNSDAELGSEQLPWIERAGHKLRHWFAQNLLVAHPRLTALPLGLANRRWAHGDPELLRGVAAERRAPDRLLHAAFDVETHPDRRRAWAAVMGGFGRSSMPALTAPAEYLRDLARHRFCACPRGNGIDTHRFWECQYLGVTPVVERCTHTCAWSRAGLPMVLLDDWSELSPERLERAVAPSSPRSDCLRLSHYTELVGRAVSASHGDVRPAPHS